MLMVDLGLGHPHFLLGYLNLSGFEDSLWDGLLAGKGRGG